LTQTRVPKAAEILAQQLRQEILAGQLGPGTGLWSEVELVASSGFSRPTVREAVRLLEAEGFLEIRRGRNGGISVREPDLQLVSRSFAAMLTIAGTPIRQLFEFRRLVEPAAAASAAQRATPEQRAALVRAASLGPADETATGMVSFHELLTECTGNELLRIAMLSIHRAVSRHAPKESLTGDELHATNQAHSRIAKAIADGDAERAEAAMRRHLVAFERILKAQGRLDSPVIPPSSWAGVSAATEHY